jgi:uncharacterized protein (TIGR02145 family)
MTLNPTESLRMSPKGKSRIFHLVALISITAILFSCDQQNLPPIAKLSSFPPAGDTSIFYDFSAAGSSDDRDYEIGLTYRWDFEGDGTWDTEYSNCSAIAHKYGEPGLYGVRVEVRDLDGLTAIATDTIELYHMNTDIDTLTDTRDGNRYRIVKIHGQWWMAENLRYGLEIPTDREQTDNDTVERYRCPYVYVNFDSDTAGGVYRWFEAMNYQTTNPQGICPDGWHIPSSTEWESLFSPYTKPYLFQYYRKNGHSNLNLDLSSRAGRLSDFSWDIGGGWSAFWASTSGWYQEYWRISPYIMIFSGWDMLSYTAPTDGENSENRIYASVRCLKNNTD